MATNKAAERFATLTLLMPASQNISSGQPLMIGEKYSAAGVAVEAQNTSNPAYDNTTGYLTVDFEGVYFLTVVAETLGSISAGAAINTGDPVFFSGGTYDKTSGITYGGVLCADAAGDLFGMALAPIVAGTTAIIPVLLKNCVGLRS